MRAQHLFVVLTIASSMFAGWAIPAAASPSSAAAEVCFSETGKCIRGRFLDYWQSNGGLTRNGYPLSEERRELLEDGEEHVVQYFERVRLELHPKNAPPYDVLLGQFGRRIHRATSSGVAKPGAVYFPETGNNLKGRFLDYWQQNGGLAQFGYPISEEYPERLEDGATYTVQYFERARFEYHPEYVGTAAEVLLGQFGRLIMLQVATLQSNPGFFTLYTTNPTVRDGLGLAREPASRTPGATQGFERGRMFWRGDQRWIYVLAGPPQAGDLYANVWREYFPDTWVEGQEPGGGPGPAPGLYKPQRGFGQLWRERVIQPALGYATSAEETGYAMAVEYFAGGLMLTSDTSEGRYIYVVLLRFNSNGAVGSGTYIRYSNPVP